MNFMNQFNTGSATIGKRSREDGHLSKDEYALETESSSSSQSSSFTSSFPRASNDTLVSRRMVRAKKAHEDKKAEFAKHIEALNRQFKTWFKATLSEKPDQLYTAAAQDYLDHLAALQARYLRTHGEVLTFGSGDCGQLAHGVEEDRDLMVRYPRVVASLRDKHVAMIACGGLHNAVVTADGEVFTWGCADDGSLGRSGDENVPGLVPGLEAETVIGVACGDTQTLVYTVTGQVFGWGCFRDKEGKKFFNPSYAKGVEPRDDIRKQQDGALLVQGFDGAVDSKNAGVVELACGSAICLARCADGSVYSWGLGELGELGRGALPALRDKAGAYQLDDILRHHMTPKKMQVNVRGMVSSVGDKVGAKSIGAGAYHSLLVLMERNVNGNSINNSSDSNNVTVEGIYTCGLNNYGQLGLGSDTKLDTNILNRIERVHATEGGVNSTQKDASEPFPSDCSIVCATGGVHHSLALCNSRTAAGTTSVLYSWGRADSGQLGIAGFGEGAGDSASLPHKVIMPIDDVHDQPIQQIACGGNHNIVLVGSGTSSAVYTWGYGDMLALGHGKEQDEPTPRKLNFSAGASVGANASEGGTKGVVVTQVAGGGQHSAIVAQITTLK